MKLLFVDIEPVKSLREALLAGGCTVESSALEQLPEAFDAEVVVCKQTPPFSSELAGRLREQYPHSWIALVVEARHLLDASEVEALLNNAYKDDVWEAETWNARFGLNFQRAVNDLAFYRKWQQAEEQMRILRSLQDDLAASSDALVHTLEKNLSLAVEIQRSLIPKAAPDIAGMEIVTKYIPAAGLGGDYFDVFEFGDKRRYGFLFADSKTHGMAAALLSALLKVRLEELRDRFPGSKMLVEHLFESIRQDTPETIAPLRLHYGILDRSTLQYRYTSAGEWTPWVWRGGQWANIPIPSAQPLGTSADPGLTEEVFQMHPGDRLLWFSNGLDQALPDPKELLTKICETHSDALTIRNELVSAVRAQTQPLPDDLTLVVASIATRTLFVAK